MPDQGSNSKFIYLYRDGDNYKKWGSVVFEGAVEESHEEAIRGACESREFFVAGQVRVPEVFLFLEEGESTTVADHGWHEFWALEATGEPADDELGRTVGAFVAEFVRVADDGWERPDVMRAGFSPRWRSDGG